MKKTAVIMLVVGIMSLFSSGCVSTRSAYLKVEPDGSIAHADRGIPVIQRSINPVEAASASAIITRSKSEERIMAAQASMMTAQTDAIKQGKVASAREGVATQKLIGVVINDHLQKMLFFDNPQMAWTYNVKVGGYEFLSVDKIPDKINFWYQGGTRKRTARVKKEEGAYNGVPYQFVVRIKR